jgi:hypothetical protein
VDELQAFIAALQSLRVSLGEHCIRPRSAADKAKLALAGEELRAQVDAVNALAPAVASSIAACAAEYVINPGVTTVHVLLTSKKTGLYSAPWWIEVEGLAGYGFQFKDLKKRTLEYKKRKYLTPRWVQKVDQDVLRDAATISKAVARATEQWVAAGGAKANADRVNRCRRSISAVDSLLILAINTLVNAAIVFDISYALSAVPVGRLSRGTA